MATQDITSDFNIGGEVAGIPDESYAPDGQYVLQVKKAEYKMSKGAATKPQRPMIAMSCSIVSGPFAGLPVFHNFVWTTENESAKRFFKSNLQKLGIQFTPNTTMSEVAQQLMGKSFNATLGHREYAGTVSNTITAFGSLVGTAAVAAPNIPSVTVPTIQIPTAPAQPLVQAEAVPVTPPAEAPAAAPAPQPAPAPARGVKPPF